MRLNKFLAVTGVTSRRGADQLIGDGRVSVNGDRVMEMGRKIDELKDRVEVDGKIVGTEEVKEYWLVNKPVGVVSTVKDTHARKVVTKLVKSAARLYPVGRLDENSEGLMILTNDGDLAFRLTHPKFGVKKIYVVKIGGDITEDKINKLRKGVKLEDGMASADVENMGRGELKMTLGEGRKREIRRMCAVVGFEVLKLKRVAMGSLNLGDLNTGESRKLTTAEVGDLKKLVLF